MPVDPSAAPFPTARDAPRSGPRPARKGDRKVGTPATGAAPSLSPSRLQARSAGPPDGGSATGSTGGRK